MCSAVRATLGSASRRSGLCVSAAPALLSSRRFLSSFCFSLDSGLYLHRAPAALMCRPQPLLAAFGAWLDPAGGLLAHTLSYLQQRLVAALLAPSSTSSPAGASPGPWRQALPLQEGRELASSLVGLGSGPSSASQLPARMSPPRLPAEHALAPEELAAAEVQAALSPSLALTLSCVLAPTDPWSGGFQRSPVCRAPVRTLLVP